MIIKMKFFSKVLFYIIVLFFLISLISCSLKYDQEEMFTDSAPEFTFKGLEMNRIEEGNHTATLTAQKLEQYRNDDAIYASNVSFTIYNSDSKIVVTGSCSLLSADTKNELYFLDGNVDVNSHEQNLQVKAERIKWNGKTEQLVSSEDDKVIIGSGVPDNSDEYASPVNSSSSRINIEGTGFSASGVSMSYVYENHVQGTILTDVVEQNDVFLEQDYSDDVIALESERDSDLLNNP
jgi:LPS export ABC transporter protein LptC